MEIARVDTPGYFVSRDANLSIHLLQEVLETIILFGFLANELLFGLHLFPDQLNLILDKYELVDFTLELARFEILLELLRVLV